MIVSWPDSAVKLISSVRVMTIATYSLGKGPWSAPVYYVHRKDFFYFFSNFRSRHISDTGIKNEKPGACSIVSASIFSDSACFQNIKGLQMTGAIEPVPKQKEAVAAAADYIKKFGINVGQQNTLKFIARHFHASFYKFIPETVFFMDNSVEFGFREKLNNLCHEI